MKLTEQLRAWARRIKQDGVTLWFASKHPDTPIMVNGLCFLVVAYALSPIDLVPDFIPVLGYLDDVILLPCLIWLALQLLPEHVVHDSRIKAQQWMARENQKPSNRWGPFLVLLVWALVAWAGWAYVQAR